MAANVFEAFLTQLQQEVDNVKAATDNAEIGRALIGISHLLLPWLKAFAPSAMLPPEIVLLPPNSWPSLPREALPNPPS